MNFSEYNEIVRQWTNKVTENHGVNAELTLKYCNDIIDYATNINDSKLLGFAYYYLAETYYCLNDGDNYFSSTIKAIEHLKKVGEWAYIARSYNILGIVAVIRGNLPIAYDYYLNGLMYCKKYNLLEEEMIININCGVLNIQGERYAEALGYLEDALAYIQTQPDSEGYHSTIMCIYSNIVTCRVNQLRFDGIDDIIEIIKKEHWPKSDYLDKIGTLITEAYYYHKSGQVEKRDECIEQIDSAVSENIAFMDMVEDYFKYAQMLLECDKEVEFWHILDTLEPMIRSFNITDMQLKSISLKIKFYRKNHKNAEYLQAAGLFYELSEKRETESKSMIGTVLNLRNSLENANQARKEIEKENEKLVVKSGTDPLTGLANRAVLSDFADEAFTRAKQKKMPFIIEILDIDYFKEFNDNYGHQRGDECLIEVAECIQEMANKHNGFCARYGGDEFVLIYENATKDDAVEYALELKKKIVDRNIEHTYSKALPIVTISQGLCCDIPDRENKVWDFLHTADNMLYKIKKKSRNSYCVGNKKDEMIK